MVFGKVEDLSDVDSLNPESKELGLWLSLENYQGSVTDQKNGYQGSNSTYSKAKVKIVNVQKSDALAMESKPEAAWKDILA